MVFAIYRQIFNRNVKVREGANTKVLKSTVQRSSCVECYSACALCTVRILPAGEGTRMFTNIPIALFTVLTFLFALQYNLASEAISDSFTVSKRNCVASICMLDYIAMQKRSGRRCYIKIFLTWLQGLGE